MLSKEEIVYPLLFYFFSSSLILLWIFKYYCDLFIAAQCSASLSYFQVDIFTGRREGRYIDLYMGGVTLDFVTALCDMPGRASFCCCLKGSVTFSWSSPQGPKDSELAWFHQPSGTIYRGSVWRLKSRWGVIYVIGSVAGGSMVACWHFFVLFCVTPQWSKHETMATWHDLPSHSAEC